ncbi:MAG: hypothetical protein CL609_25700 [Anaerolineaceae bacterium]|nr:hypothetical protein [Anaerolineaceae bacterium]
MVPPAFITGSKECPVTLLGDNGAAGPLTIQRSLREQPATSGSRGGMERLRTSSQQPLAL